MESYSIYIYIIIHTLVYIMFDESVNYNITTFTRTWLYKITIILKQKYSHMSK